MLDLFMNLSEEELAHRQDLQDVRAKLLQASLMYFQSFIKQSGDDPPLQADWRSHLQVAKILYEIGSTPAAEEALEQALRTQERHWCEIILMIVACETVFAKCTSIWA